MIRNLRKDIAWIKTGIKLQFFDKGIIIDLLLKIFFKYILLIFLWKSIFNQMPEIKGWDFEDFLIYILFSVFLSSLVSYPNIYFISLDIKTGNIINNLIKPSNYPKQIIFKNIGIVLANIAVIAPIVAVFAIKLNVHININLLYFLISAILGIVLYIMFDCLLGLLTFWTENSWGISLFKHAILQLFTGGLFPLNLFPEKIYKIVMLTPFPNMLYKPVYYLLGYSENLFKDLFVQVLWIVIFLFLLNQIYNKSKREVLINGG